MPDRTAPDECANCGASIPPRAKACPECGADERTGWRDASVYDGLDLPEHAGETHATRRAGGRAPRRVNGIAWYWWLAGVLLIFAALVGGMGLR
jgi:hypothetical protein